MTITQYSNPTIVYKNATKYLGKDVIIKLSTNATKKYMVFNPIKRFLILLKKRGFISDRWDMKTLLNTMIKQGKLII